MLEVANDNYAYECYLTWCEGREMRNLFYIAMRYNDRCNSTNLKTIQSLHSA